MWGKGIEGHRRGPGGGRRASVGVRPLGRAGREGKSRFAKGKEGATPAGIADSDYADNMVSNATLCKPRRARAQNGLTTTRTTIAIISTVGTSLAMR